MGSTQKKPDPDFLIRLVGSNVKPWSVPLRTLSRVLAAVQRLVDQRDELVDVDEVEVPDEELAPEFRTLQLLSVTSMSAGYAVHSANRDAIMPVLRETGRAINEPDDAPWHPSTISSLDDLSQIAKQLGCIVELREPGHGKSYGDVIAVIRPDTYSAVRRRAFIHGHTSAYGRLERVGGATAMKCGIHVKGRVKMLFCDVANSDLVRELGKYIYTDVVLSGPATWYRFNRQLKSLTVTSFSPAKTGSFADVAKKVRAAGGNAWDEIADPDAFIREMRG